jgi:tyrosine-protein phosphatase YwqE
MSKNQGIKRKQPRTQRTCPSVLVHDNHETTNQNAMALIIADAHPPLNQVGQYHFAHSVIEEKFEELNRKMKKSKSPLLNQVGQYQFAHSDIEEKFEEINRKNEEVKNPS